MADELDLEAELRAMAADPGVPVHLKLGALKQLVALRGTAEPAASAVGRVPARTDGLPADPLLADYPPPLDEHGQMPPADPMADLSWGGVVGRAPHALYARVLHACPWHPTDLHRKPDRRSEEARILLDAEARFLREARNLGFDTEADEVAEVRRRRRREQRRNGE